MKFLIVTFFISFELYAGRAPHHFANRRKNTKIKEKAEEMNFTNYFDQLLGVQENILDKQKEKSKREWYFDGMITNFSVSKKGLFGFSALKASSGVELEWQRRPKKIKKESLKEDSFFEIKGRAKNDFDQEVDQITNFAKQSGKVSNISRFKRELRKALNYSLNYINPLGVLYYEGWRAKKVRLDLSFSTSGRWQGFAKAGAAIRIRTDWKIIRGNYVERIGKDQYNVFSKLVGAFDNIFDKSRLFSKYDLSAISVALGASNKGEWGIGTTKVSLVGKVFFYPPEKFTKSPLKTKVLSKIKISNFLKFSQRKIEKGMRKTRDMARFFIGRIESRNGNWYVPKLKLHLDFDYSGIFSLSKVTGKSSFEFYFKRNQL